ncbi:AAA family ATPase [Sphingopyxis sp.]|jgi:predicted ATPase|uniref:AAA family ATPase n=1 Tax=Sphingopyxis sp. TaxID=1908224 RepID=UPI00311D4CAE
MRLRSVWISQYKNLRDFKLSFDGDGFIDIFVGKNGSGKSNFLEALIEIFDHIFDFDPTEAGPGFDYTIQYELDRTVTIIEWTDGVLAIDGNQRRTMGRVPRPENVIVYYSGQNRNVGDLIERYEARFRRKVRGAALADSPAFIGIGPDYKKLLILLLLLLPEGRAAREFLVSKLGIQGVGGTVDLTLSQPAFARNPTYDHLEPGDLFWGLGGITRAFLDELVSCIKGGATPGALHDRETNLYRMRIDVDLFRRVFAGRNWHEIFQLFNNLKILSMLDGISLPVTLHGFELSDLGLFSDGQFQSVYLFAIAELFKDRNCVTLLDEPDAFLHPEWQFEFLKQTDAISEAAARTNHILMSSHSAATLIPSLGAKVKYFEIKDGGATCYPLPKRVAIEKMSSKLIRYTEEEQLLSIVNAIQIENKPVFFTEGSIDPIIIKEAWHRIYGSDLPFIPFYAFSCSYLKQLLTDDRVLAEMGGKPMFGLFDMDKAFDHWNGLNGDVVQGDWITGKCKKLNNKEAYAFLLPLPENEKIRAQVLIPGGSDSFGGESLCEIEHLFYGDPRTAEFFETEPTPGGGERIILKSDSQKVKFAKEVIPTLDDRYFHVFKPMFDFLESKIKKVF